MRPEIKRDHLSIGKRDDDCYDVYDDKARIAALRADFTTDEATGERTVIPGTWAIRWEFNDGVAEAYFPNGRRIDMPDAITFLSFGTVHEAFAFLCGQVLT